jgi:hypothetical protein
MGNARVTVALGGAVVFLLPMLAAAQTAPTADADMKEIAAYRMTMADVKKFANVMRAVAEEMKSDPKLQEIRKIEEEMDKLSQKEELTDAEAERMEKLRERREKLEESGDDASSSDNPKTLADMEAAIRKQPAMAAAIQRAGFTPRQYVTFTMAYMQAAMVVGFSQGKVDFAKLPAGVNPDNVKFVMEHKAELDAMQKEFEALNKKPGGL